MDGILGFALAGFALAGSPGPATLSLAATGAALTRHFRDPRTNRAINIVFAVLLVASLAVTLWF